MPQNTVTKVKRFLDRTFVNSKLQNVQSVNWRADYKLFSGISYADMVKSNLNNVNNVQGVRDMTVESRGIKRDRSRTCGSKISSRSHDQTVHSLVKHSDVDNTIIKTPRVKQFYAKVSNHDYCTPVKVFNRFDVFNITQDIETQNSLHSESTSVDVNCVNKHGQENVANGCQVIGNKIPKNVTDSDKILSSDCKENNKVLTGKYLKSDVVLIEMEDKYDLELRFKPKHRQRISEAKSCNTFKIWDQQMEDKYGFIPLGELNVPEHNVGGSVV